MTPTLGPSSPLHALPPHIRAKRQRQEYAEQSGVVKLYQSIGASVYVNSVYGAHPKGVTPGMPDTRIKQPDWRLEWDHEVKPAGKRQSKPQYDYMRECQAMGTVYVLGGISEAFDFLDFLGIVKRRLPETAHFWPRDQWRARMDRHLLRYAPKLAESWYTSDIFARQIESFGYKPSVKSLAR